MAKQKSKSSRTRSTRTTGTSSTDSGKLLHVDVDPNLDLEPSNTNDPDSGGTDEEGIGVSNNSVLNTSDNGDTTAVGIGVKDINTEDLRCLR